MACCDCCVCSQVGTLAINVSNGVLISGPIYRHAGQLLGDHVQVSDFILSVYITVY